jgi:hypothetical protein
MYVDLHTVHIQHTDLHIHVHKIRIRADSFILNSHRIWIQTFLEINIIVQTTYLELCEYTVLFIKLLFLFMYCVHNDIFVLPFSNHILAHMCHIITYIILHDACIGSSVSCLSISFRPLSRDC